MNPTYESQLLSISPKREIVYTDIYNFNVTSIAAGASFSAILAAGAYLTGTAANTGLAIAANTYQSVFDTAPGTTAPLAAITQFQVQVGGQNMFQQNFQYYGKCCKWCFINWSRKWIDRTLRMGKCIQILCL